MNSPLPHSITLPWHPYLPPPSISTLTVYHLVLPVCVAVNACVCEHTGVCVCVLCGYVCTCASLSVSAHSQWWSEMRWTLYIVLYGVRRCCAAHQRLTESLCFRLDGWNTGTHSHRRDSGSFFIKVYSGASPEFFPSNLCNWFPLNLVCLVFFPFVISSSSLAFLSPVVIQWLCFTPRVSSCDDERATFIEGNQSVLSNSPASFWLWEKWSLSLGLPHMYTCTHAHIHTRMHTQKLSLPCCPSTPQGYGHAFSLHIEFFLFVLLGLLWSMTWENTQWEQIKWLLAVQTSSIELFSGFIPY